MRTFSEFFPIRRVRWLLPLSFMLALIAYFPAELAWRYSGIASQLPKEVKLVSIGGSVWNAQSVWQLQPLKQQPLLLQLKLNWQLGITPLWQHGALLSVRVQHPGTSLQLLASPSSSLTGASGQLSGQIDPLLLNPLLKKNKAWIDGTIGINALSWRIKDARPSFLQGTVIWQGGDTYFIPPNQADRPQLIRYPQLALRATTAEDGSISAIVSTLEQPEPLASVVLQTDGWLAATLYGRLKQAVPDLPVPRKPADQALIKYKEKLF